MNKIKLLFFCIVAVAFSTCAKSYRIGGFIRGLNYSSISLQYTGSKGTDVLIKNSEQGKDVSFTFLRETENQYDVSILTQPIDQTCLVVNGKGSANSNISDIQIICTDLYSLGVKVSGLASGATVVLQNNNAQMVTATANESYFFNSIFSGLAYNVTVKQQPASQLCTVMNGTGSIQATTTIVDVACVNVGTVSAHVSGLASGATVVLQNNGAETISATSNDSYPFSNMAIGASYNVTVKTQPPHQYCSIQNPSGTLTADGAAVLVVCTDVKVLYITPIDVALDGSFTYYPAPMMELWGFEGADAACADHRPMGVTGTPKAVVVGTVEGETRRACLTPSCAGAGAAENRNWPLHPNTRYVRADGLLIGTTNAAGLLPATLANPINTNTSLMRVEVWTGLGADWTTDNNCNNWTGMGPGLVGAGTETRAPAYTTLYNQLCNMPLSVYCAIQ